MFRTTIAIQGETHHASDSLPDLERINHIGSLVVPSAR